MNDDRPGIVRACQAATGSWAYILLGSTLPRAVQT
jgi:hypothetical protein